jgi:hypothetical protein
MAQKDNFAEDTGKGMAARIKMTRAVEGVLNDKSTPSSPAPSEDRPMKVNPKAKYGDRGAEKRIDVTNMVKKLGVSSYKKGGKIPGKGPVPILAHGGERVLNVKQTKKYDKGSVLSGRLAHPSSYKDGGTVQKTGMALVHKGETVIPADQKFARAVDSDTNSQNYKQKMKSYSTGTDDNRGPGNAPRTPTKQFADTLRGQYGDYKD